MCQLIKAGLLKIFDEINYLLTYLLKLNSYIELSLSKVIFFIVRINVAFKKSFLEFHATKMAIIDIS